MYSLCVCYPVTEAGAILSQFLMLTLRYQHHFHNIYIEKVPETGFPQSWKILENSKNSECHGNLFARKKVMEISCPNPPNRVPIVL